MAAAAPATTTPSRDDFLRMAGTQPGLNTVGWIMLDCLYQQEPNEWLVLIWTVLLNVPDGQPRELH